MLCSPAEIEKKRQEALQRLAKKSVSVSPAKSGIQKDQLSFKQPGCSSPLKSGSQGKTFFRKKPYDKMSPTPASKIEHRVTTDFYGLNKSVTITISLISSERFCVKMPSFSSPVIEVLKTVSSKNYDPKTRTWNFLMQDYDIVLPKLKMLTSVIVEELPRFVVNCLKCSASVCDIDTEKIDPILLRTLLPFQFEGLRFGVHRGGRCLIADDMGLGKTFQALAIMNHYKSDWPLLIVTTASMKNVWEETIFKYLPSISILQIQYMVSGKDYIGNSSVLIVSHDLMSRCCEKLLERGFDCVIIDESHNIKNYKTKVTQAAIKLCKRAKRVVLLSGTPALSRPKELYTQLSLIDEKFFGSFFEYARRYCDLQQTNFGLNTSGKSNLQELEIVLKKKFMLRRKKEDVLGSLPNKTQEVIKLNVNLSALDDNNRELLETLSSQFTHTKKAVDKHAILLNLFSETAKIKIPAVCCHIGELMEMKKKFLVFGHHLVMLDAIEKLIKYKGCKYVRIDGTTSGDQRKYFVDKFQTDESYVCALLSITAANAGITLTAAHQVVFAELHWNPSILSQAEARAHRIGQENAVLIQYLVAEGTADDHIWPLLQEKQTILREMGLTKDTFADIPHKIQVLHRSGDRSDEGACAAREINTFEDTVLNDGLDDLLCNIDI